MVPGVSIDVKAYHVISLVDNANDRFPQSAWRARGWSRTLGLWLFNLPARRLQ